MQKDLQNSFLNRFCLVSLGCVVTFLGLAVRAQHSTTKDRRSNENEPRVEFMTNFMELAINPFGTVFQEISNDLQVSNQLEELKLRNRLLKRENFSRQMRSGGADAGGGGVVYVCFQQGEMPIHPTDPSGVLRPELVNQIKSFYIMDLVKAGNLLPFQAPRIQESPRRYIDRVLDENFLALNSRFVIKVKNTLDQLELTWEKDAGPQPLLGDFYFQNPWSNFCTPVQVITRHSKIWRESGKVKSSFHVDVDHNLLHKIRTIDPRPGVAVINEAILMLHEALYQIATEMGQKDANGTHELLAFLLSNETPQLLSTVSNPVKYFQLQLSIAGFTPDMF